MLEQRSWRWLRTRVEGLLSRPPTIAPTGQLIQSTRIALQLEPPRPVEHRPA